MAVFCGATTNGNDGKAVVSFYCRDDHGVMDAVGVPMLGSACELMGEVVVSTMAVFEAHSEVRGVPMLCDDVTVVKDTVAGDTGSHVYLVVPIEVAQAAFQDARAMQEYLRELMESVWRSFCRRHPFLNGALVPNTGLVQRLTSSAEGNTKRL